MAALSWRFTVPAAYNIAAATWAQDTLVAINSHFTANSGAGDAVWEIVEYVSSSPRSILLRRKNGDPGRIVIFGQSGSTPNSAAVRSGGATSGALYIGYSPTSTSNTVDGSWLSGAPLSASDYIEAVGCSYAPPSGTESVRFAYAETSAGIIISSHLKRFATPQSAPTVNANFFGAGEHVVDLSGSFLSCVIASAQTISTATAGWTTSGTSGFVATDNPVSYFSFGAGLNVRKDSSNNMMTRIFNTAPGTGVNSFLAYDDYDGWLYIEPCYLIWDQIRAQSGFGGKLRQMGIGPQCYQETYVHDSATDQVVACGISPAVLAIGDAFWLVSEEL